ncbi:MAG: hypothetical protein H6612_02725 [Ignavibacteriales bacterium]|nr:hypothetical protein [Ignavibacteriales bacterium]
MKISASYKSGFKVAFRNSKVVFVIYFLTLIFGLLFVLPFKSLLSSAVGNSMSVYSLIENFDYLIYSDFLTQHKDIANLMFKVFFWLGLFYLFFTIFINGGILSILNNKKSFTLADFFNGCGKYSFRFFRLFLVVIIIHIIITAVIYSSLGILIEQYEDIVKSEITLVIIAGTGVFIHLLFLVIIFLITDYTKIIIVKNDSSKVLRSFWKSVKFVFSHLLSTYSLYIFLLIIPLIVLAGYLYLENLFGMISPETIMLFFIIQQMYIWFRIFTKVWIISSEFNMYSNYFIPDIEEAEPVLIAENEEWNFDDLNEPDPV